MIGGRKQSEWTYEAAKLIGEAGGRALLVGGCVRDEILGHPPKDIDFEVFGLELDALETVLARSFKLNKVGVSFGVIKITPVGVDDASLDNTIDVSLPRRETKLGEGHRAFAVEFDTLLSLKDAAARRDFTINAIYKDPLTGENNRKIRFIDLINKK